MRSCRRLTLSAVVFVVLCGTPAAAGIAPYLRADYGFGQLRMTEANRLLSDAEKSFRASGYPADLHSVAPGVGPSATAGLWLTRWLRVGAMYASQKSNNINHVHVPGAVFYAEDLDFRMEEIGAEAALRFEHLAGLTLGGHVASAHARMIEGFTVQDASGDYFQDAIAERTRTTYGMYLGIDQTNSNGVAGYFRMGYQFRDMGSMPSQLTISDGINTIQATGNTVDLDYSGWYLKLGVGFDVGR